jgi:hypothetical protein
MSNNKNITVKSTICRPYLISKGASFNLDNIRIRTLGVLCNNYFRLEIEDSSVNKRLVKGCIQYGLRINNSASQLKHQRQIEVEALKSCSLL